MWLLRFGSGKEQYDLFTNVVVGFIFAVMLPGCLFASMYSSFKPKWKFLNSADTDVPDFGNKTTKTFDVERTDFKAVKDKLKEKRYEITFYDDVEQYIIKFHSNFFRWSNNSICGMITYDAVAKTATVTCFPTEGYTAAAAKETQIALDKIECLIVNK